MISHSQILFSALAEQAQKMNLPTEDLLDTEKKRALVDIEESLTLLELQHSRLIEQKTGNKEALKKIENTIKNLRKKIEEKKR